MADRRDKRYAQPGYRAGGDTDSAFLAIIDRVYDNERGLNFSEERTVEFQIRFLPDTNEVVVTKGDEIVYSEILP